jgi:alkylation response protein AidB-like acyl-CoA dehydrogenase
MNAQDHRPGDEEYRGKARAWLKEHASEYQSPQAWESDELAVRSMDWARRKHAAGYSAIAHPTAAGGAGGTERQAQIFAQEEAEYFIPTFSGINIGFNMAMGTIRRHGTTEQYERFGRVTHSGEAGWCQLFSEPGAGSDLAAVRTRAVRQGDDWVVNGQKVWSSWAHHADYGILLARHDPSLPKHKGLTLFVCDMHAPGVEVRPIRQITGKSEFNEVFLTDVVIPDSNRIGGVGDGWTAAMTLLGIERNHAKAESIDDGLDNPASVLSMLRRARDTRRISGSALDSAVVRAQLAQFFIEEQGLKHYGARMRETMALGEPPLATMPLMKIIGANKTQRSNALMMDLGEYAGLFAEARPGQSDVFYRYLWGGARRISGGAEEVMRNQLAERALGLPGDVRADKDVPFDQLPF